MKKLLLALALTAIQFTNAQAPTAIWQKCYGGSNDDDYIGTFPIATSDGGYVIGLGTQSNDGDITGNHGEVDVSLMKINATGTVQLQKCFGCLGLDNIRGLFQTADGGYLIVGETSSNDGDVSGNHGGDDLWLFKINTTGTILWQKCIGGSGNEKLEEIIPTADGGYIGVGKTTSINNGDVLGNTVGGAWVFKITNLGVIQWQKVYQEVRITGVLQTPDGGYVYSGEGMFSNLPEYHGGYDVWVAKVNQGGTIQWQKCYGGSGTEEYSKIIASNDGGYFFTSRTFSNDGDVFGNHGGVDCWVVKIDASGTILGQNCFGGSGEEGGGYIQKTLDGGVLVMSSTTSNDGDISGNHGGSDAWAIKLSVNGAIQWQKCFGGTNDEFGGHFN